jgi:hypothetical protein
MCPEPSTTARSEDDGCAALRARAIATREEHSSWPLVGAHADGAPHGLDVWVRGGAWGGRYRWCQR